uniref:PH domain-containing protein n=2 Tax=Amphora coffeiformis TaxID=265554 RepID=A0A7S3LGY7_9STRA|mmetsp:Transcript_10448/g.20030  ORF Transcript_10448/g.20030 Transcript_10448/m.20030 type:complete len:480 (+) Transcript_10448:249-1688(+)|eukprot:scaffold13825_cov174-Amphora_coffeaeformis.AAC.3
MSTAIKPATAPPPQIIRRNDVAPGIPETNSNLSGDQTRPSVGSVPSSDHSSNSGSESNKVERMNPFEQQMLATAGSHHSTSPERNAVSAAPSSPTHASSVISVPRSPASPFVPNSSHSTAPQMPTNDENDDYTHSSSAVNSTEPASSYTPSAEDSAAGASIPASIQRFLENTRKRLSTTNGNNGAHQSRNNSADDLIEDLDGMIICGYLQKLGRNGKWQTRWFESDGECLSYYKNENRTKLLATLDLEKVGTIGLDPADQDECAFTIQVLGRLYHLRAENKVSCTDWVITLNRIKEAHMQQGNVKLVQQAHQQPVDLLDQAENIVAPRVVVVSNRQRTRAVAETQDFDQIMMDSPDAQELQGLGGGSSSKRLSTIGTVVLARWNKRRSGISRLRSKLTKWARSLRKLSCASEGNAGLDNHVHPPGHDDARKKKHLSWIGKETSAAAPDAAVGRNEDEDASARMRARKMSSASEDIRVLS